MAKLDENGVRRKTGGRLKGTPNKNTTLLKDAIIEAATAAGDKDGLVGYLTEQARKNPQAFLPLLGKVLPLQVNADVNAQVVGRLVWQPPQ